MEKMKMVILDNGHGKDTKGKQSPWWQGFGVLYEWEFNRDIVRRITRLCRQNDIPFHVLVPEDNDVSLQERVRRANMVWDNTKGQCFLLSIHANAGLGTGYEVYTSRGQTKSDTLATMLFNEMKGAFPTKRMRTDYMDGDPDKESDFYILKHTKCPALLSENFFMDNYDDCMMLFDDRIRQRIAYAHYQMIRKAILQ